MDANSPMTGTILNVEHLSMKFGGLVAIGDLSFEARRGEITALIGPNGAGKTTVFNCITGFYKPSEGMIRLASRHGGEFLLERMADFQITAKAKVARTFQNIRLFSGMTVLENLLVAQHNKLMKASGYTVLGLLGIGGYRQASAESIELAKHWLAKANLVDRADDPAGDLPYGAQRRLEIARAMCTEPELLCLDEPAAGLNPIESLALNTLLIDIKNTTGTSILLIEHDMSVVMQISDHVVVLEYGRKISDGDPQSVRTDPRVIAAYLGVDDEEVETVLTEVGDENVIEELDAGPDAAHSQEPSSSMLAGPVSDTVDHRDAERVTVSKGASKAAQLDSRGKTAASRVPARRSKAKNPPSGAAAPATKATPAFDAPGSSATGTTATPRAKPASSRQGSPVTPKTAQLPKRSSASARPAAASTIKAPAERIPATGKTQTASKAPIKPAVKPASAAKSAPKASTPKAVSPKKISNALAARHAGKADDLLAIKGIGPVNQKKLNAHGIFHFDQIAAWKKSDVEAAEAYLAFDGRIAREDWIGQAKTLAKASAKPAARRAVAANRGGAK